MRSINPGVGRPGLLPNTFFYLSIDVWVTISVTTRDVFFFILEYKYIEILEPFVRLLPSIWSCVIVTRDVRPQRDKETVQRPSLDRGIVTDNIIAELAKILSLSLKKYLINIFFSI